MAWKGTETVSVISISTLFEKGIVHILMLSLHNDVVGEFRDFLLFRFVFQKPVICEKV